MFKTVLIIFLLLLTAPAHAEQSATRVGYAYSIDSDELLYTEHHHEAFVDELVASSVVIYKDLAGNQFASKRLDFSVDAYLPEFSLLNQSNGHEETTRYLDDEEKYEIVFLELEGDKKKKKALDYAEGAISDAGFDNFVITHWGELVAGEKFTRQFLIPSMLRFLEFRIYQSRIVQEGNKNYRVLHIEPDSFFLRVLSGTVRLYYEIDRPVLRKFAGTSNIRDAQGKNYRVLIRYEDAPAKLVSADAD